MMKFLFSTIGQKIQIALSGILLSIFLLFHLINNLALFAGPDTFNAMVGILESIKPIIRIMEFGLLLVLLMHVVNALNLNYKNQQAKPTQYAYDAQSEITTLNSRTMAVSGTIILLFFIVHLSYIWYTYQVHSFLPGETYYDVILRNKLGFLGHFPTALFYILSIVLIAFHIKHGFQSSLKTFGIISKSKLFLLNYLGFVFWGIIPSLFIIIVLSIQLGIIK